MKIEALDALKKFSESDVAWRKNASILALENAEEDASKAEIERAAKNSEAYGLGVSICKLLHGYVKKSMTFWKAKMKIAIQDQQEHH